MARKTRAEMTKKELANEVESFIIQYDNEVSSIYEGYNEKYDQSDLENWDEIIRAIWKELDERPLEQPEFTISYGEAGGGDVPRGKYYWAMVRDYGHVHLSEQYLLTLEAAQTALIEYAASQGITITADQIRFTDLTYKPAAPASTAGEGVHGF
jgi:hypothetical protein